MRVLNLHSHKITHEAKSDAAASCAFLEASEDIAWLVFCEGTQCTPSVFYLFYGLEPLTGLSVFT